MTTSVKARGIWISIAICVAVALGVAALDAALPLGFATAALYSIVIVACQRTDRPGVVVLMATLCVGLIIAGAFASPSSPVPLLFVILNRAVYAVVVVITAILVYLRLRAARALARTREQLERANRELSLQARRDGLTGVANRRWFDEQIVLECERANRAGTTLSLLMIDVDHFKHYNDSAGHQAGDACLKAIAGAIQGALRRPIDIAARYGGEEFAVILPTTSLAGAVERAEEILRDVRALAIPHPAMSPRGVVTVSIGVATRDPPVSAEGIVELADRALYRAKDGGRDRLAFDHRESTANLILPGHGAI